jgi:hypothetical protein
MARIRDSNPAALVPALAIAVAVALAAPASAHQATAADPVIAASVGGSGLTVERHGDPLGQFTDGASTPAQVSGVATKAAAPTLCPTVSNHVDDSANDPHAGGRHVIKVIYAYPANVGNRLPTYSPVIQAGVRRISELVAGESGGSLSVRFDIGTFEGPHCLDIQSVALPQSRQSYSSPAKQAFGKVADDVFQRLGPQGSPRDYLIYTDLVAPAEIGGEAEAYIDPGNSDIPAAATHNQGGLFAILYGRGGTDFFGSATSFAPGTTSRTGVEISLHELSHNLGAVQLSAPHSSGAGHCNDGYDLMCYEDGGPGTLFVDPNCDGFLSAPSDPYGSTLQAWDCNKDDYFNPSPAPGSYLDTHWNLADSAFLCTVATCTPSDAQPPNTTLEAVPLKARRSSGVKLRFHATERASFRCKVDGRSPKRCRSPYKAKVKRGRHVIRVTATDAGGITELSPAKARFRVRNRR